MEEIHIDIETYCEEDLKTAGVHKYCAHPSFEILIAAYAIDENPIKSVDLAQGEELPDEFISAIQNHKVVKKAHNAAFEYNAFNAYGLETQPKEWRCTMIQAAYCGWPLSLDAVSKAMQLGEAAKDRAGKDLIKYFCQPCKPTKSNEGRTRNLPHHASEKWEAFKDYCIQDVVAEKAVDDKTKTHPLTDFDWELYALDQKINDKGVLIDLQLVDNAMECDEITSAKIKANMKRISGLANPNSQKQIVEWLEEQTGITYKSIAKDIIPEIIADFKNTPVAEFMGLRQQASKTSVKKYKAMKLRAQTDHRARGLFQYYGAGRTGRWAGRSIQLQNLKRNSIKDLDDARNLLLAGDFEMIELIYGDSQSILSELIRTAIVAPPGELFRIADYKAIEARVTSWIADEQWRIDVFNGDGKIYEASAAMMFGVALESVTKDSEERQKGKIAELALGYGGSLGALMQMGGESMGLSEEEMKQIVAKWRKGNPNIVKFWYDVDRAAKSAIKTKRAVKYRGLIFRYEDNALTIQLFSGRKLFYQGATIGVNRFDGESVDYYGTKEGRWQKLETYGGKLTENIVQAISRDLLGFSMLTVDRAGYDIVMHVHDEVVCPGPSRTAEAELEEICELMAIKPDWAEGLPLKAAGYTTPYYLKD